MKDNKSKKGIAHTRMELLAACQFVLNQLDDVTTTCQFALDQLNNMTTEQFQRGADKPIRDRLKKAIAKAEES